MHQMVQKILDLKYLNAKLNREISKSVCLTSTSQAGKVMSF